MPSAAVDIGGEWLAPTGDNRKPRTLATSAIDLDPLFKIRVEDSTPYQLNNGQERHHE